MHQLIHAGEAGDSKQNENGVAESKDRAGSLLLLRLGLGIFLAMNLMAFNWLFYSGHIFGFDFTGEAGAGLAELFAWLMLFLATLVIVLLGVPLFLSQWQLIRESSLLAGCNIHSLILIGVLSAYGLSVWQTVSGQALVGGRLYFDTAAMTLILVTLGAYLDSRARLKALSETGKVMKSLPDQARILDENDQVQSIEAEAVKAGDRVVVAAGEHVPVDGRVTRGASYLNESHLTGEAKPRAAKEGDWVFAGSLTVDGEIVLEAERVGASRLSAQIMDLLGRLQREKSPMQSLADKVARFFLPGVMLLAAIVFTYWAYAADFKVGLLNALSVLLISCPCALGLASPLATFKALKEAAASGVIFRSPLMLEKLAGIGAIYFDKTGTLTRRELSLNRIEMNSASAFSDWREALALAAIMESGTRHVIASSIESAASSLLENAAAFNLDSSEEKQTVPGLGIKMGDWRLGSEQFILNEGLLLPVETSWQSAHDKEAKEDKEAEEAKEAIQAGEANGACASPANELLIYLFNQSEVVARFVLGESIRPAAARVMETFLMHKVAPAIVSGDREVNVKAVAQKIGIAKDRQFGACLPQDKVALLQAEPKLAALVGDGMNDAPALAASSVGIVMSHAPDLSQQAGGIFLVRNDLSLIEKAYLLSRKAIMRIRLNLFWAFAYNIAGLSLAATGTLSPLFAGTAMVMSSLLIILTSSANYFEDAEKQRSPERSSATFPLAQANQQAHEVTYA